MIDHTGHAHPSTPKARALCRANGGTGFIGKLGGNAPVSSKSKNDKKPDVPHGPVNTAPKKPEPPKAPPPAKITAPKSHGVPKPVTPPAPKVAPPPTNLTSPGKGKELLPRQVDKNTMEVKGITGDWHQIGSITKLTTGPDKGKYEFRDKNNQFILRSKPTSPVETRTTGIPRVSVPPKNLAGTMGIYIPAGSSSTAGSLQELKIQNALRTGASRDFIKEKSTLPPDRVDAIIDRMLTQYGVPNHVYPRKGNGVTRNAATVKPAKPADTRSNLAKLADVGRVEAPDTPESATLKAVRARNTQTNEEMKKRGDRVLAVQEAAVGDHISRIKSIKTGIPTTGGAYEGLHNANGTCLHGRIHIHKDFHTKADVEAWGRTTGFKVHGGDDPLETTLAHEMGHALMVNPDMDFKQRQALADAMIEHLGLTRVPPQFGRDIWSIQRMEDLVKDPGNQKIIKRKVSKYAATNANEFFAEIWADYTMNPKVKPHIRGIGEAMKAAIKTLSISRS